MFYIPTKYEEILRTFLISVRPVRPTSPVKLALRARPAFGLLRKALGAGPRRDIVGA